MEREKITRKLVADSLRFLRTSAGLTQRHVSQRGAAFKDLGFGRLLESQISDFERGKALPSLGTFINLLAACSLTGSEVDFGYFQKALIFIESGGQSSSLRKGPSVGLTPAFITEDLPQAISERLNHLSLHYAGQLHDVASRLIRTERELDELRAQVSAVGDATVEGSGRNADQGEGGQLSSPAPESMRS